MTAPLAARTYFRAGWLTARSARPSSSSVCPSILRAPACWELAWLAEMVAPWVLLVPTRTMRITNLRVNAVALNVYNLGNSFSLTTINTTVSFNGTNFGGNQIVNVQNGTVRIGLLVTPSTAQVDLLDGAATFLQCNATEGYTTNSILLSEGFPTAFKVRNFAQIIANGIPPGVPGQFYTWNGTTSLLTSPDINQNVPNALYNTETGINFDASDITLPSIPLGVGNPPLERVQTE